MKAGYFVVIVLLLTPIISVAEPICHIEDVNYIDLPNLIEKADAIVILRVERNLYDPIMMVTFYSTRECYIYQTLKGDIPKGSRIKVRLYNLEGRFPDPYARFSKHLIFLVKKADENEPTDYRMLTLCGAQTLLKPSGHEKMPKGDTIEEQVKNLIKDAIDYQTKEHQKRMKFLNSMIGQSGNSEQSSGSDSLEAAGFTEEVLTRAFEIGCALVVVRVSSVRGEKYKSNTIFYYYQTHVLRSIMDGDFITKDLNDSLELYAGASYGEALTPGSVYALFIIQKAQYYWAIRDAAIKVDSAKSRLVADLSKMAAQVYEETSIFEFRKSVAADSMLPDLPEELLLKCDKFRRNPDRRAEFAKAIAKSDLGSQLDQSRPFSSVHIYEKPKVILSRSQALSLLGEPTLKSGRNYLWYCGRDSSIDQPAEWVGVLSLIFDSDANVNELRYLLQEEWKWRKG
ncbi:MAG: hypothetical protein JSU85_09315 [Candidatus Zixiibacteriota bacterium]|nr:MAG: hypothetical protein JSU85_09315 [candidate division Zixibacteria bacterium]